MPLSPLRGKNTVVKLLQSQRLLQSGYLEGIIMLPYQTDNQNLSM